MDKGLNKIPNGLMVVLNPAWFSLLPICSVKHEPINTISLSSLIILKGSIGNFIVKRMLILRVQISIKKGFCSPFCKIKFLTDYLSKCTIPLYDSLILSLRIICIVYIYTSPSAGFPSIVPFHGVVPLYTN